MANWGEKFSKVTQAAISKSKEVAEVTRLNMETSTYTQRLKTLYSQVGEYIIENGLLEQDEKLLELRNEIFSIKAAISENAEKVNEIKNINICPNCGSEVLRNSRFCDKCGAEINREILETKTEAVNVCKNCGEPLIEEAVFCGNCGSKQE